MEDLKKVIHPSTVMTATQIYFCRYWPQPSNKQYPSKTLRKAEVSQSDALIMLSLKRKHEMVFKIGLSSAYKETSASKWICLVSDYSLQLDSDDKLFWVH